MQHESDSTRKNQVSSAGCAEREPEGLDKMFDLIAAGLYNLASMLVGEGEEGARLVEATIATAEVSVCSDAEQARTKSRRALCRAAIASIAERNPESLAAPEVGAAATTCIEDDDLGAAGVSREELERMLSGPDRGRVRTWLEGLPVAVRTVFVLRAVARFSGEETASLLAELGGAEAAGWTPDGVRESFRQGLCSLASQLIHASVR
jgi:DNA-directed RNA polymerase specialized sigma24 family protein